MPRPATVTGVDGLPLWDTFEAMFFVVLGLSIGLVLGFLLPSLWRTLRRRFRDPSRFAAQESVLPRLMEWPPELLWKPDEVSDSAQHSTAFDLKKAFVVCRGMVFENQLREAAHLYIEILGHERITRFQTNRALFELSQVYKKIGLCDRSFDVAFELLGRKPRDATVCLFLLRLCDDAGLHEKVDDVVKTFKGKPVPEIQIAIAHSLAAVGEWHLARKETAKALLMASRAAHWDFVSGRARILLWQATSTDLWERVDGDLKKMWILCAADIDGRLDLALSEDVSPSAGAAYLGTLFSKISTLPSAFEVFEEVRGEFFHVIGVQNLAPEARLALQALLIHGLYAAIRSYSLTGSPTEILRLAHLLLGEVWMTFESFLLEKHLQAVFFRTGFQAHRCLNCMTLHDSFAWRCSFCSALESYRPEHRLADFC